MYARPSLMVIISAPGNRVPLLQRVSRAKVAALDDSRTTPAHELEDGHNYHPTKSVLFGITSPRSPVRSVIGPGRAAQFGYMPGLVWLLIGVFLAGAVQDF